MFSVGTVALLTLSLSNLTLAAPQGDNWHGIPQPTCTANYITTIDIQSVPVTTYSLATITTVATIPYSCYTYTEITTQSNNTYCGTFDPSTCTNPIPDCIRVVEQTVPCYDSCCPTTATATTAGGCASCQTDCLTSTMLVTPTGCPPMQTY